MGGAIEQSFEFGDILFHLHELAQNGMVLHIGDGEFSKCDERHQVGLDVGLEQALGLAVWLAADSHSQSRRILDLLREIGMRELIFLLLVLFLLLLRLLSLGDLVQVLIIEFLQLMLVDLLGLLLLLRQLGVLLLAGLIVIFLAVAPGHDILDLLLLGLAVALLFSLLRHHC